MNEDLPGPAGAWSPPRTRRNERTLMLAGDTLLQDRAYPAAAFAGVRSLLAEGDMVIVQGEGLFAPSTTRAGHPDIPHKPKWRHSEPSMVSGFVSAGITAVSSASNVAFGADAIRAHLETCAQSGLATVGVGLDLAQAQAPVILVRDGWRVGLLSRTAVFWPENHAATPGRPGVATLRAETRFVPHRRHHEMPGVPPHVCTFANEEDLANLSREIAALRSRCDAVVLSCHWGISDCATVADYQRVCGRAAIDAGADIVFGHHPHVLQEMEWWHGRPIFHSLGNFAFDWSEMRHRHREGLLVRATFRDGRLARLSVVPVERESATNDVQVRNPQSDPGARIFRSWAELCRPAGGSPPELVAARDPRAAPPTSLPTLTLEGAEIVITAG